MMNMQYIKGFEDKKYGLLGEHLSHSFSPQIHSAMADYPYTLCEVERENLKEWVSTNDLCGYNVTIPYKQEIMQYLDNITDAAKAIGAVNTVWRNPDGTLTGDNTDYYGFEYMLNALGVSLCGKKALVLGSGGASKTVQAVLAHHGAQVIVFDLEGATPYSQLPLHPDACAIVNATPVGMYPNTGKSLVDLSQFTNCEAVLDVVYNPAMTAMLLQAKKLSIPCINGLSMLVAQAKRACELFTSQSLDDTVIESIRRSIAQQTENVVLVGMPGCGKSTVGKLVAQMLCRDFVDADDEIKVATGKSPSEIITNEGEEAFRKAETQVLSDICKESSKVIATGGGAVTIPCNKDILMQNGAVIFIERDTKLLAKDDRPLSKNLDELYKKRYPLYKDFSVISVDGNADAQTVAQRVVDAFCEVVK